MSKFGKYAIVDNIRYPLEKEPTLWWEFKPPTAREEISINRFTQGGSIKRQAGGGRGQGCRVGICEDR